MKAKQTIDNIEVRSIIDRGIKAVRISPTDPGRAGTKNSGRVVPRLGYV